MHFFTHLAVHFLSLFDVARLRQYERVNNETDKLIGLKKLTF